MPGKVSHTIRVVGEDPDKRQLKNLDIPYGSSASPQEGSPTECYFVSNKSTDNFEMFRGVYNGLIIRI